MLIETRYGIDYWEGNDQRVYMPHLEVNGDSVTVAYQINDGAFQPFDYSDETLCHALSESALTHGAVEEYLTLDTETGLLTFYDRSGAVEQSLKVLPQTLEMIRETLESDPKELITSEAVANRDRLHDALIHRATLG